MIEFILDILFNNPEGLTFALFGLKKKRKKAEKLMSVGGGESRGQFLVF